MALGAAAVAGCIAGGVVAAASAGWGMRRLGAPAGAAALAGAGLGAGSFCELSALASGVTTHVRSAGAALALLGMAAVPALAGALLARRPQTMAPAGLAWLIAALAAVCMLPAALSPMLGGAPIAALLGNGWWLAAAVVPVLLVVAVRGPATVGLALVALLLAAAAVGWAKDPLLTRAEARAVVLGWPALLAVLGILGVAWLRHAAATPVARPQDVRGGPSRRTLVIAGITTASLLLAFAVWLVMGMSEPPTVETIRRAARGDFADGMRLREDAAQRPQLWQEAVTQALSDSQPPVRGLAAGMVRAGVSVSPEAIVAGCTSGTLEARSQVGSIAGMAAGRLELAAVLNGIAAEQHNALIHDMIANDLGAPLLARWSACVGVGGIQPYWEQLLNQTSDTGQTMAMLCRCIEADDPAVQVQGWRWASLRSVKLPPAAVVRGLASSDEDIRSRAESALRAGSWWKDPRIRAAVTARALVDTGRCTELLREALGEGHVDAEHQAMLRAAWLAALAAGPASAPRACLALFAGSPAGPATFAATFDARAVLAALRGRTEAGWPDGAMPAVLERLAELGLVDPAGIEELCLQRLDLRTWPDGRAATRDERAEAWNDVRDVAAGLEERCPPSIWTLVLLRSERGRNAWYQVKRWLKTCPPGAAADPGLIDAMWSCMSASSDDDAAVALAAVAARGGLTPARVQSGIEALIVTASNAGAESSFAAEQLANLAKAGVLTAQQHSTLLAAAVPSGNPMRLRAMAIRALLASGAAPETVCLPAGEAWPVNLQRIINENRKSLK